MVQWVTVQVVGSWVPTKKAWCASLRLHRQGCGGGAWAETELLLKGWRAPAAKPHEDLIHSHILISHDRRRQLTSEIVLWITHIWHSLVNKQASKQTHIFKKMVRSRFSETRSCLWPQRPSCLPLASPIVLRLPVCATMSQPRDVFLMAYYFSLFKVY